MSTPEHLFENLTSGVGLPELEGTREGGSGPPVCQEQSEALGKDQ